MTPLFHLQELAKEFPDLAFSITVEDRYNYAGDKEFDPPKYNLFVHIQDHCEQFSAPNLPGCLRGVREYLRARASIPAISL